MTTPAFNETDHPREGSGEFAVKDQSAPEISELETAEIDAALEVLNARRTALYTTIRDANLEVSKLTAKAVAIEILAAFPTASTLALTESDQSETWWPMQISDADGGFLAEDFVDFDATDIPMSAPDEVVQTAAGVEYRELPGFDWLTINQPERRGFSLTGVIDLRKAAAQEI